MPLSDRDIKEYIKKGKIKIEPCDLGKQLAPVGIDLRLGDKFRVFDTSHRTHVDLATENFDVDTKLIDLKKGETFVLHPGEFVLGMTEETVELSDDICAKIDGRSSLGRLGIIVHSTAGHVDPGWKGKLTLEISNIGKLPIELIPGMRFCCLRFEDLSSPAEHPYRGKYLGSRTPVSSKIGEEFSSKEQARLAEK